MATSDAFRPAATGRFVSAILDDQSSIIELTVTGSWNRYLWLEAHGMMRKCLTSHPAGLLLNLLNLDDAYAASAPLWFTAAAQGHKMTPPVPVAACVQDRSRLAVTLHRLGARRRLGLFPDLPQARAALAGRRPLTDQIRLDLPAQARSAATARQIVAAACREWNLATVVPRARLVAAGLVINAVEHAGTELHFTVTRLGPPCTGIVRRHNTLYLAVHDLDPCLPPLPYGQGLLIIDGAADYWGALPTSRGKMVWATLRERS